jgi:enamine deaminase RidA (YjgF/YER057c/UK114 family)
MARQIISIGQDPPARALAQAAALPRDALVEIDAIAALEG